MNRKRPVNLDISTIKLPITAYVSILHRISGVFLFVGAAVLLWILDASLASEEGFADMQKTFANPFFKFVVWVVLAALAYHAVAGLRHLTMDGGVGESLRGGRIGAQLVVIVAVVLFILAGVWVW